MRLHSWLLLFVGLVALGAASMVVWPASTGVHKPSLGEAAMMGGAGLAALLLLVFFVRRDRRDRRDQRDASHNELRTITSAELASSGVLEDFIRHTSVQCVNLTVSDEAVSPFASKFGGTFYAPAGFAWPMAADGRPLWPLAQLNFAELPHLEGFPTTGILQFFIRDDDDMYGAAFDQPTDQCGFRVIYHSDVSDLTFPNPAVTEPAEADETDDLYRPFEGEYRLIPRPAMMFMDGSDWRFSEALGQSCRRVLGWTEEPSYAVVSAASELLADYPDPPTPGSASGPATGDADFVGHHIGGYPSFTQGDPREGEPELSEHTVVLLQIESLGDIEWGDAGQACFLIEPERLSRLDFSNVAYIWDCH